MILWQISEPIILWVDPAAGTFPRGEIQAIAFGISALFIAMGAISFLIKIFVPGIYEYMNSKEALNDFEHVNNQTKIKIWLTLFVSLLFVFSLLVGSV